MAQMTNEEADYWDDYFTKNPPKLGPNGSGWISRREARFLGMDDVTVNYLITLAEASRSSVGQIINQMVQEKISAAELA